MPTLDIPHRSFNVEVFYRVRNIIIPMTGLEPQPPALQTVVTCTFVPSLATQLHVHLYPA